MGRSVIALAAITVAVIHLGSSSAAAGVLAPASNPRSPQDTRCNADYDISLDPGLSTTARSGTYTSHGETGTWACDGTADGRRVTGIGTWGEQGRYGITGPNTCAKSDGEAVQTTDITMPTAEGRVHISTPLHVWYGPLQGGGAFGGSFEGPRLYGTFTFMPTEGDCVTHPVTRVHVALKGWLVEPARHP